MYSSYAITFWSAIFAPRILPRIFTHTSSMKFTMAFSNTPGPLKPITVIDHETNEKSIG